MKVSLSFLGGLGNGTERGIFGVKSGFDNHDQA
jgi:hypothetical protein